MEEMIIWEQYTVTLNKDPKMGFGLAISGGRDKPNPETGDTAVVVSDVVRNGPAAGRLHTRDQIVMVNGVSMENVTSSFTIQHLKTCGKTANITLKRPRKIQIPASSRSQPSRSASHSNLLGDEPPARRGPRRGSDSGSERGYERRGRRARSYTPERNGEPLTLMSGFKRLPPQAGPDKPIKATLLKKKLTDEYGLKLGSQIFIKHMTDTGLASKEGTLQEGDLVLKINGITTENLSLLETKHLVEKSKGKLTMTVLRDDRKFLVSIPEVEDSLPNSEDDGLENSSSDLEGEKPYASEYAPSPPRRLESTDLDICKESQKCCREETCLWQSLYLCLVFRYSSDLNRVKFMKQGNMGLRLVGGNDVGIFVGGVQPSSPAQKQGMKEGDQILQVNGVNFGHFTREEAAMFLINIHKGEDVEILTQNKIDIYRKILKSNLGDSFYIRTHFDHEAESNIDLSFTRGEVFRILDTMHRGKLGNWLAVRMGRDLQELDKGTIPNQTRCVGDRQVSGPRAEFWKLRGLRGAKKNIRKSRDDLIQLTIQGKYPAYEKVLLREAGFKRPVVVLGPLNDIAMEKLAREKPDEFQVAEMVPRSGGQGSSSVIKLDTVRQISEQNKHALVDITPTAVEKLSYIQYHPLVLFLDAQSRKDVKTMRQRLSPNSKKSSRRLYAQARKTKKYYSHLFAERIELNPYSDIWYDMLKDKIRLQQAKPVWVSEVMELDTLNRSASSDYLSCDSRVTSDYEDTDGEIYTDGEAYTDDRPPNPRNTGSALARSSEPALGHESSTYEFSPEFDPDESTIDELPPILHVPKPSFTRRVAGTSTHGASVSLPRSFSNSTSEVSTTDPTVPPSPSDVPPDFRAPDPQDSFPDPPPSEDLPESPEPASLSAIEEKLQQVPPVQCAARFTPSFTLCRVCVFTLHSSLEKSSYCVAAAIFCWSFQYTCFWCI
uniref:Tight junction protein 3 n=1 Tax=Scleropages formosus TaxID=113540 RepID=A0A8C9TSJ7_SCLFO